MADATNKSPMLSRNLVMLILGLVTILAVAAVILTAVLNRNSPFKINIGNKEQRIEFEFDQNISLSEMIDRLLSKKGENSADLETQKRLVRNVLENYKFYSIPSEGAAAEIRRIRDTGDTKEASEFVQAIRNTLYDLDGPFSQPKTFLGIRDDRLLNAFDDLNSENPKNPLLVAMWEWNLQRRSFLNLRNIQNVQLREKPGLAEGIAATCVGSVLIGKTSVITTTETGDVGKDPVQVVVDQENVCPNSAATSSIDLLDGKGTIVWISPKDMQQLRGEAAQAESLEGVLTPIPKDLRSASTPSGSR